MAVNAQQFSKHQLRKLALASESKSTQAFGKFTRKQPERVDTQAAITNYKRTVLFYWTSRRLLLLAGEIAADVTACISNTLKLYIDAHAMRRPCVDRRSRKRSSPQLILIENASFVQINTRIVAPPIGATNQTDNHKDMHCLVRYVKTN
jgi:hypothetical protein